MAGDTHAGQGPPSPVGLEEKRRSCVERGLGPLTVNGLRHSMLTLCSTALGGGVLSMSFMMATAGVGLGTAMICLGALLAYISTVSLMRMSGETGHATYAGLFAHCAGRMAAPILDFMLFLYGSGACVGYLKFFGDFVPSLLSLAPGGAVPAALAGPEFAVALGAGLVLLISLGGDDASLRFVAPISVVALIYMACAVALQAPELHKRHAGLEAYGPVRWAMVSPHLADAFAMCVFAFNCHLNVVNVAGALVRPTDERIVKVSLGVNLLQLVFYFLIGVAGYLSFLDQTPGDILLGYEATNPAVVVGRVILSGTMVVATALNLGPAVRSLLQLRAHFAARAGRDEPLLAAEAPAARAGAGARLPLAVVCLAVQAWLAVSVPSIADVIQIMGATVSTAMTLAIPGFCISVAMPKTAGNRARVLLLYGCSLLALSSVPVKLLTWAQVLE